MIKKFNDTGICNPNKHYMVDITKKIEQIMPLINDGQYFAINRPRQYGKSTTSRILRDEIEKNGRICILISFEGIGDEVFLDEEKFVKGFLELIAEKFEKRECEIYDFILKKAKETINFRNLSRAITDIIEKLGKETVLIIDEVDKSSNNQLFMSFLGMVREKYLKRDDNIKTFQSVVLIGVHDVKTLKLKLRPDTEKKYNSPWNIASDFNVEMSFSVEEIRNMLEAYKNGKNIDIDTEYFADKLRYYTSGYPFFISKLCKIIDEKIMKEKKWERNYVEEAIKDLLNGNSNPNFDELIKNLENNEDLFKFVNELLIGRNEYNFEISSPIINLGTVYGIIDRGEKNKVKIHNKIYEEKITNYMISKLEIENKGKLSPIQSMFIKLDGRLDFKKVLIKFQEVIKEKYSNSDLFKSDEFLEKDLRMMFLVFLKPILNGIGFSFKEVQTSAERRLDIIVIFKDEKFVVELKLWHGKEYHKDGLLQLKDYMRRESIDKGYMLIMSKVKDKQFEMDEQDGILMVWV